MYRRRRSKQEPENWRTEKTEKRPAGPEYEERGKRADVSHSVGIRFFVEICTVVTTV